MVELGNPISAIQRKWIEHFFSYVGAQAEHTLAFYTPRPSRAERGMAKLRFLERASGLSNFALGLPNVRFKFCGCRRPSAAELGAAAADMSGRRARSAA
jgi:hypothetical protein